MKKVAVTQSLQGGCWWAYTGTSAPPPMAVVSERSGAWRPDLAGLVADLHPAGLETPEKPLRCPATPAPGQRQ